MTAAIPHVSTYASSRPISRNLRRNGAAARRRKASSMSITVVGERKGEPKAFTRRPRRGGERGERQKTSTRAPPRPPRLRVNSALSPFEETLGSLARDSESLRRDSRGSCRRLRVPSKRFPGLLQETLSSFEETPGSLARDFASLRRDPWVSCKRLCVPSKRPLGLLQETLRPFEETPGSPCYHENFFTRTGVNYFVLRRRGRCSTSTSGSSAAATGGTNSAAIGSLGSGEATMTSLTRLFTSAAIPEGARAGVRRGVRRLKG